MPQGTLILRADASVAMGTGHVMRCLALAQAWQDEGGECIFAMAEAPQAVKRRLRAEKCEVVVIGAPPASEEDIACLLELGASHRASWVVVDGYQFRVNYQRALKAAGLRVLVVDDGGRCRDYCADLVLDQGLDSSEDQYRNREGYTRLMLGTRYVMLRREFRAWRSWKRATRPIAQRLLITIGGSDPDGLTFRVIEALSKAALPDLATTVLVGGSNPRMMELQRVTNSTPIPFDIVCDPPNVPELMANSDLAVICAGGTLWELLYMGCASLSYSRDEVQGEIVRGLHGLGAVHDLGSVNKFEESGLIAAIRELAISCRRRQDMAEIGRRIVDGEGACRVLQELLRGDSE
jgi:UDP-2,4-diacetamido-2,4,6-trideoxy-beta-L-altropyranose hydrolase